MGNFLATLLPRKQKVFTWEQKIKTNLNWNTKDESEKKILKKIQKKKSEFFTGDGKICLENKDIDSKYEDKKTDFDNHVKTLYYLPESQVNNLINGGYNVENNIFDLITKMKGNDIIAVLIILGFSLNKNKCKKNIKNLNPWDLDKKTTQIDWGMILIVVIIITIALIGGLYHTGLLYPKKNQDSLSESTTSTDKSDESDKSTTSTRKNSIPLSKSVDQLFING